MADGPIVSPTTPDLESQNGATRARRAKANLSAAATGTVAPATPSPTSYYASIYPGPTRPAPVPPEFADLVKRLEAEAGMPVWMLVQSGVTAWDVIDDDVPDGYLDQLDDLPDGTGVALLIDSPGGLATSAYRFARVLQKRCGGFVAMVPRYAKSAATLVCLGAQSIVMGDYAELGPLDAQIDDPDREGRISALDEVQALSRLTVGSLESVDQLMMLLLGRTGKRVETLLPHAIQFVAETTRPLYEKIDTVHYTQTSRLLRVAEQYAVRLLMPYHPLPVARQIAAHLIEHYPTHEFVIDREEAEIEGLQVAAPSPAAAAIFAEMIPIIRNRPGLTLIGRLKEVTP